MEATEEIWLPLEDKQKHNRREEGMAEMITLSLFIYFLRVVSDEHPGVGSRGFSGGSDLGEGQGHRGQR